MNDLIIPDIEIIRPRPAVKLRPRPGWGLVDREDVGSIAGVLLRLSQKLGKTEEYREGVLDLAEALGVEVVL